MAEKQDELWLQQIIQMYANDALRTCWFMLKDRQLAEDAVQETFEKIWKHRKSIRREESLAMKPLILKIAMNTCRDVMRSAWWKHIDRRIDMDTLSAARPAAYPDSDLMIDVMRLPYPLRQVVLLYHFHRLTTTEISKTIGISQPAVVKRLKKSYRILKYEKE